ncbi:MAG: BON domain-containing protein [Microcoleaceae cyanobacterium]
MNLNKLVLFLIGGVAAIGATACDVARTSADAPTSVDGEVEDPQLVAETQEDAQSEIRQAQLDSDIRAREQRNDLVGDQQERTDADLESEVRAKLEANIPASKLTVQAEEGIVTVAGTVPDQKEYDTIPSLVDEILGVNGLVMDNVEVVPPTDISN